MKTTIPAACRVRRSRKDRFRPTFESPAGWCPASARRRRPERSPFPGLASRRGHFPSVAAPESISGSFPPVPRESPVDRRTDTARVLSKIFNELLYIYNVPLYIVAMKARKLHNRIAVLRRDRGLTRPDLARLIGVNHQTVGYLEREEYNPSLDLALRLGEVFGLPVEMIFSAQPLRPLSEELADRHEQEEDSWPGP